MTTSMSKAEMLADIDPIKMVMDQDMADLGVPPGPARDLRCAANPSAPEFHSEFVNYQNDPTQCGPIAQASNYLIEKLGPQTAVNLEFSAPEVPVIDFDTPTASV